MESGLDTGFFKWVWRFNALALAGLLLFAGAMVLWEMIPRTASSVSGVVNVDPADETLVETLQIGGVTVIDGLIRYSVGREQTYDVGYSSGKSTRNNTLNYGYLDPESGDLRWLLDGFDALILETIALRRPSRASRSSVSESENDETQETVATLFLIVDQDTSGDKRLSRSDIGRLALSMPDGTGLKNILEDVHAFRGVQAFDAVRRLIRYEDSTGDKVAILNLATLTLEKTLTLTLE
ncbi:MAG: hypothetical protein HKN27_01245 [Silicimonas sp.]|nr:hypothetical protein [Silicimonas sp.]